MAAAAVCPICGGTGWKIIERAGLTGAEPCRCAEEARTGQLKRVGHPAELRAATLDTFQIPQENPVARTGSVNGPDASSQLRARVPRSGASGPAAGG